MQLGCHHLLAVGGVGVFVASEGTWLRSLGRHHCVHGTFDNMASVPLSWRRLLFGGRGYGINGYGRWTTRDDDGFESAVSRHALHGRTRTAVNL